MSGTTPSATPAARDPELPEAAWDELEAERAIPPHAKGQSFEDSAPTITKPAQLPLHRPLSPADPYPVDALGPLLSAAAKAFHERTLAPMPICGNSALAVASVAAMAHADIKLPTGEIKPTATYFLTIAGSGERKSAVDKLANRPIRRMEDELRLQRDIEWPAFKDRKEAYEQARASVIKHGKGDQAAIRSALHDLGQEPEAPPLSILLANEPTLEGIHRLLREGFGFAGIFSSEGGQFLGGHAMSQDNKLKTAAGLSSLWDGDPLSRVRQGDGASILPGRRLAMHLMAQPDVSAELLSDRLLRDQGLLSRVLLAAPATAAGTRHWREPAPGTEAAIDRYDAAVSALLSTPRQHAPDRIAELRPRALAFAPETRQLWIQFADAVETNIGPGGIYEPIRGLASKLPEHAARIAGVITMIENPAAAEIPAEQLARGIALAQFHAGEAVRLYEAGITSPDLMLAERLLAFLRARNEQTVKLRDIYQFGPAPIREKATALRIMELLAGHGYGQKQDAAGRQWTFFDADI